MADVTVVTYQLGSILRERDAQDGKWGEQNHPPEWYLAILVEEVGELAQAIVQAQHEEGDPKRIRRELVQVAAVALAMLECCDRNRWSANE